MPSVNKQIIVGHVGKEPTIRRTQDNSPIASFSVATSERWKDKQTGEWQDRTEWHNVVCFRWAAEKAERSVRKGVLVYVEGKTTHRKYTDKDGNDRYMTEVVADTLHVLEKKDGGPSDVPGNDSKGGFNEDDGLPF